MINKHSTEYYCGLVKEFVNSRYKWYKNVYYTKEDVVNFCVRFGCANEEESKVIAQIVDSLLTEFFVRGYIKSNGEYLQTTKKVNGQFLAEKYYLKDVKVNNSDKNSADSVQTNTKREYISLEELGKFNYKRFGTILKQKQLLPPSYDRKPESVEVYAHNGGYPIVKIKFVSSTSDSYRVLKITPSDIYEFVNGSKMCRFSDKERYQGLVSSWNYFKNASIRDLNYQEDRMIDYKITEMKREAEKIGALELLKEVQEEFINKHQNHKFTGFYDSWSVPHFSLPRIVEGKPSGYEMVTPMTPKTLELCVLRLEKDAKLEEADDIEFFKDKCEQIAEKSVYPGEWADTVERLVDYLIKFKIASQVNIEEEK